MTMTPLKSLAHPEWPYSGSAHEWRGFVKDEKKAAPKGYPHEWDYNAVYQKQKFGPELT